MNHQGLNSNKRIFITIYYIGQLVNEVPWIWDSMSWSLFNLADTATVQLGAWNNLKQLAWKVVWFKQIASGQGQQAKSWPQSRRKMCPWMANLENTGCNWSRRLCALPVLYNIQPAKLCALLVSLCALLVSFYFLQQQCCFSVLWKS